MGYIKNPSEEQKAGWVEKAKEKENFAREQVEKVAKEFRQNPDAIVEYLEFGSKLYRYSVKNTQLIYAQNEGATFVQSFKAWKDEGYSVNKGETGLCIWVPVSTTLLKVGQEEYIQLRDATKEQKDAFRKGDIEGITKYHFKIGTVFDISQTNFPPEKYPELLQVGYESAEHNLISEALMKYSEEKLKCPIMISKLDSISLRGYYLPGKNEIHINELLKATEKLSTITHEIGHAIVLHGKDKTKTTSQCEYEGDCISIMLQKRLGLELTETRKRHFSEHYKNFHKEIRERNPNLSAEELNEKIDKEIGESFNFIFNNFSKELERMKPYLEKNCDLKKEKVEKKIRN